MVRRHPPTIRPIALSYHSLFENHNHKLEQYPPSNVLLRRFDQNLQSELGFFPAELRTIQCYAI